MTALPALRVPDPTTVPSLRWGIVGAGMIADAFARALRSSTTQRIVAVAARSAQPTAAFAARHGIDTVYASAGELAEDRAVDVVHIATPHPAHRAGALAAIAAGKHVLVEKPFAVTRDEAAEMAAAATAAGVFAMEAMWPRYHPYVGLLREVLAEGLIGDVHHVAADFGFVAPVDAGNRMWNPELGGGALLDAGVYPVSFASHVLGPPDSAAVIGAVTSTGVDARATVTLSHPGGVLAVAATSMTSALPNRALVVGSAGRIELPAPFFSPPRIEITTVSGPSSTTQAVSQWGVLGDREALAYQAVALAGYVAEGRRESPLHPLAETVQIIGTLQDARDAVLRAG